MSLVREVNPVAPASITACEDISPEVALGIESRRPLTSKALAIGMPSALKREEISKKILYLGTEPGYLPSQLTEETCYAVG